MSSLKEFLYQLADEIGRSRETMNPIIKIFEENWYDSVESIKSLDEEAMRKLNVPLRLIELIRKKLSSEQPMQIENTNVKKETHKEEKQMMIEEKIDFNETLQYLKKESIESQKFLDALQILEKITSNIVNDPKNEQYRTLRLSNEKLKEKLFRYNAAMELLLKAKFEIQEDILYMRPEAVNISSLKQLKRDIQTHRDLASASTFNPYSSYISSTADISTVDLAKSAGSDTFSFAEKLEELKKQRDAMIKPYIQNKEVKLFTIQANESIQSFVSKLDQYVEEDTNEDEILFKKEALKWAKQLEESQQFSSRRKKEFEQLLKQPLFTESRIRIKFPNNTVFEAKFSPKELVKSIVDTLKEYLIDPTWSFYLYRTPPIQKFTSQNWLNTLEEADLVPNALLYFALDDKKQEANIKEFVKLKPSN